MSEIQATNTLNQINLVDSRAPWYLSFSYGRALQASVLKEWMGKDENILNAQTQLLKRAKANGLASIGKYEGEESSIGVNNPSLHVDNYSY